MMHRATPSLVAVAVVFALAFAGALGCDGADEQAENRSRDERPTHRVTAEALANAFEENEVAATNKYKGAVIEVTGTIYAIDSGFSDQPIVRLSSGAGSFDLSTVDCHFNKDAAAEVGALRKGRRITIKGVCRGEVIGSAYLKGCVVVR